MEDKKCTQCGSITLNFVKYEMKNGVKMLRKQCFNCGRLMVNNYKRNFVKDFQSLPDYDYKAREANSNKRIENRDIKLKFLKLRNLAFIDQMNYYRNVYLKSLEWKNKRDLVMKFYEGNCNKCHQKANDVHHLNYDNIFVEKFTDLIPLCRNCHNKEHNL